MRKSFFYLQAGNQPSLGGATWSNHRCKGGSNAASLVVIRGRFFFVDYQIGFQTQNHLT